MQLRHALLAFALAACNQTTDSTPAAPPTAAKAVAPTTVPDTMTAPGSTNLTGIAQLVPLLKAEASNRPAVKLTPEKVFAAVEAGGVKLAQKKQVLGKSAGARYCELAKVEQNGVTGLVVCEYESEASAKAARAQLEAKFGSALDAQRELAGPTLVTIINGKAHPEVRSKLLEVFKSLTATI